MQHRIAIFANPIAGRGKGKRLAQSLAKRFTQERWQAAVIFDRPDEADPAQLEGVTAAVSIGGDGTLRAVVERLTDHGRHEGPGVLVAPMGTANLMGKHLGINLATAGAEDRAVAAISARKIVRLDLGQIRDVASGQARLFLLMVGIGLDGEVVHALEKIRTGPIGYASYVLPGLGAFAAYHFHEIEVTVDDRRVFEMAPAIAFIGNVKEYGTGFEILPHARSDDGLLDVCVLPAKSATDLIEHAVAMVAGEHHLREGAVYVKGKRVGVRSKEKVAVQADGDGAGWTPVEVELLQTRVGFIVPP